MNLLLLTNLATTLFMVGVVCWVQQVVHYPLFAKVARRGSPSTRRLLAPDGLCRLLPAGGYAARQRPLWSSRSPLNGLSTALPQAPRHPEPPLRRKVSARSRSLLPYRTVAWSASGLHVLRPSVRVVKFRSFLLAAGYQKWYI